MAVKALLMKMEDQVATLLGSIETGEEIHIYQNDHLFSTIRSCDSIPFGHKVAVSNLKKDEWVNKYGEPIGILVKDAPLGSHVHVHNMRSPESNELVVKPKTEMFYRSEDLRTFTIEVMQKFGAADSAAVDVADALIEAELRGVQTHGLNRLLQYTKRLSNGAVDGNGTPVVRIAGSSIQVDGNNAMGHHVARVAVDHLIAAAKDKGIAVAVVRNSNHFGFAGYYATKIAQENMIAIVTSNGTPCISVPNGKAPFFSNNPLAIAAPLDEEEFVEMDIALSLTSRARVQQALEQNKSIPEEWAVGLDGYPTTDPKSALEGSMNPIGGERGFALLFALEVLSGILSGGSSADEVASKDQGNYPEGTCHFLLAINIESFLEASEFKANLNGLIGRMHRVPRIEGSDAPRYPGERRWTNRQKGMQEGISLEVSLIDKLTQLSNEAGILFPKPYSPKLRDYK